MSLQENNEREKEMNNTDNDICDSPNEPKRKNSKKSKGGKKQQCKFCGEPPTRHDLCNRCRQKVESRSKRLVAQKFEKSGQCGSAFAAYLRRCVNFGLDPAKLTFFTTLSLMNQVFPIWHLRHESDQLFMDERGTKHSRWNMPDAHIEKVFGNLYKKELKENPILDGSECGADKRFSRNEINRILEQKLEQTLKDFGKLHEFSFSGNAYCSNDNEKGETRQRNNTENDNNMESNPQSRHSVSNERNNSNDNSSGVLCESGRSFFTPTISTHCMSNNNINNNNNSMSSNGSGNVMNNAAITQGVNPFSFGLETAPYVARISHRQSNENNLMERQNGQNGCGLSYSAPVSPMMRVQPSMGRVTSMSTAPLPSIPQEAPMFLNGQVPIGSFEQNFENLGGFAQNMRLTNSNQINNNDNNRNNNNSNNNNNNSNNNYFGSITPTLIPQVMPQNDGNGFANAYGSSNDESYDSSDGSQASRGMVSRNSSVNVNVSNNSNGNIGNMDFAWETSSLVSFGGSTMDWNGNFSNNINYNFVNNDMSSLNSLNFNDNASMISAPFGYHAVRGTHANSPVVSSNDINDMNNNNNNSPLPQFEQLPNYFHDLRDGDMI